MAGEQIPEELFGAPSSGQSVGEAIPEELLGPPRTEAAPSGPGLGWGRFGQTAKEAFQSTLGTTKEAFGAGEAPPETSPAAAPFEMGWPDPASIANKLEYRMIRGAPTIAAGVAGAGIGSALTGGPWGGIAGGALGAGGYQALETLLPAYHRNLKTMPGNEKGAWDRAVDEAAASGVFTGLSWGAYPIRFAKGPLWQLATQAGLVQPGISMAHQATENVLQGKPAGENVGQAYTEGVAGTALPAVGSALARGIGRVTGLAKPQGAIAEPGDLTGDQLTDITNKKYGAIHSRNIYYTNTQELQNLRDSITSRLLGSGPDEGRANINRSGHREVMNTLDEIMKPRAGKTGSVDFATIDGVRQKLGDIWADNQGMKGDASTARLAAMGREAIDQWLGDEQAQVKAGADPAAVQGLAGDVANAREYSRAARAAHAWEAEQKIAETTADPEKYLARAMQRIVRGGIRSGARRGEIGSSGDYPAYVVQAMSEASKPGGWQRIANLTKAFDPHSPLGLGLAAFAHSMSGMTGLGGAAAAWLARSMAERRAAAIPERVPIYISSFPSDRPKPQGRQGLLKRTAKSVSPLGLGPLPSPANVELPQERKSGGKIGQAIKIAKRQEGGDVAPMTAESLAADPNFDQRSTHAIEPGEPITAGENLERLAGATTSPFEAMRYPNTPEAQSAYDRALQSGPGKLPPVPGSPMFNPFTGGALDVAANIAGPAAKALGAGKAMFFPIPKAAAKLADKMLKSGASPESLWNNSRIFKDAAGAWRQEALGPSKLLVNPQDVPGKEAVISGQLRHLMDMPHLYQRMPKIGDIKTEISERPSSYAYGSYYPFGSPFIWLNPHQPEWLSLETLQHETQHAIDQPSGFLRMIGGDPDWYERGMKGYSGPEWEEYKSELAKSGYAPGPDVGLAGSFRQAARDAVDYQRYKRSIHEVMARAAAAREQAWAIREAAQGREGAERWATETPPWKTIEADVPYKSQLIGKPYPKKRGGKVDRAIATARMAA